VGEKGQENPQKASYITIALKIGDAKLIRFGGQYAF